MKNSKVKHTPGPWKFNKTQSYEFECPKLGLTLTFNNHIADQDATVANADLIAAAPEMLEALEAMADYLERQERDYRQMKVKDRGWAVHNTYYQAMKAAIAKAKGEA